MSERMPDFRMPSDDEVEAEHASDPARRARADAESTPSTRRPRVVAGVAAGVLALGGLAIGIPALTSPGPQAIVDEYVAAVAGGDARAAAALWTPEASAVELALLAEAEPMTPAEIECEPVVVDDDAATASCEIEVVVEPTPFGGAVVLELARDGTRWSLLSGLESRVSLFTGVGDVATVAGIEVPDDVGVTSEPLLLPGVYAAEVALTPLLEPVGAPIVAVGPNGGSLRAAHELAPSVLADVAAAAIAAVDPSASGLEATLLDHERRSWQTFVIDVEVAPSGGATVATVRVEVTLSFDGTSVAIEAGPVIAP